jgi:fructokinase
VAVSLDDAGQPTFDILAEQAYDFIDGEAARAAVADRDASLLYHGSLVTRSPVSARALEGLRRSSALPVHVDLNLRSPWWTAAGVDRLLAGASWLKVNEDELGVLAGGIPGAAGRAAAVRLEETAAEVLHTRGLERLLVTLGSSGALALTAAGERRRVAAPTLDEVVDTVGAGDAFAAVSLLGELAGWALSVTLERAAAFAASICGIPGATPRQRDLYDRHLDDWSAAS